MEQILIFGPLFYIQDVVVAGDPLVVHVAVGGKVRADHHHGHAIQAPPHTHAPLVTLVFKVITLN